MYKISLLDKLSTILVLIGALNWGFIGLANFNVVAKLFSLFGKASTILETIVYILVGLSALNVLFLIFKIKNQKI